MIYYLAFIAVALGFFFVQEWTLTRHDRPVAPKAGSRPITAGRPSARPTFAPLPAGRRLASRRPASVAPAAFARSLRSDAVFGS